MIVFIVIAAVLIIPFWIRNKYLYNVGFGDSLKRMCNSQLIQTYNILNEPRNAPKFMVFYNFFNYTANLLLNFVVFLIFILIAHFTNSVPLSCLYIIPTYLSWHVYMKRRAFYLEIPSHTQSAYTTLYKACICVPLYHTALCAFILLTCAFRL